MAAPIESFSLRKSTFYRPRHGPQEESWKISLIRDRSLNGLLLQTEMKRLLNAAQRGHFEELFTVRYTGDVKRMFEKCFDACQYEEGDLMLNGSSC